MLTKLKHSMAKIKFMGIITAFLLGLFIKAIYADDIYTLVSTYFMSCDSLLEFVTDKVSEINKLDPTDELFLENASAHPEFDYLIRTNSKGKIISKVSGKKVAPRNYRYIGKQLWYRTIALTKMPHYGNIKQKKGYFLFWNRPIKVKTKYGSRLGGTVSAKINLMKCFADIAEKNDVKFQILYKNKSIYSNLDDSISAPFIEKKLAVYGMPGLTLKYKEPSTKAEPALTQPEQQPDQKLALAEGETQKALEKVELKKGREKVAPETKKAEGKSSKGSKKVVIFISIFIFLCVCLIAICIFALKRAADKRMKLIESIDKGEI